MTLFDYDKKGEKYIQKILSLSEFIKRNIYIYIYNNNLSLLGEKIIEDYKACYKREHY